MTPTLEGFLTCLRAICDVPVYDDAGPKHADGTATSPAIIIPAKHEAVGDLTIYDDGDELTVVIGKLHHTHFFPDMFGEETSEQRFSAAITHAATFVADFLADRILISVDYLGDRCTGSSYRYFDTDFRPADALRTSVFSRFRKESTRSEHYIWSGPIKLDS